MCCLYLSWLVIPELGLKLRSSSTFPLGKWPPPVLAVLVLRFTNLYWWLQCYTVLDMCSWRKVTTCTAPPTPRLMPIHPPPSQRPCLCIPHHYRPRRHHPPLRKTVKWKIRKTVCARKWRPLSSPHRGNTAGHPLPILPTIEWPL